MKILLFGFLIAISSCNGQEKTDQKNPKTIGTLKIALPQGVSPQTMFRCSMKAKNGDLWFGTTGAGIYKYDGKLFTRYAENEGLANLLVYSIAQDRQGTIWAATDDGIFYAKDKIFKHLEIPELNRLQPNSALGIGTMPAATSSPKLQAYCVLGDKKGNIWFGTEQHGLWRYDGTNLTNFRCADSAWVEVPKNSNYKQNGFVQSLLEDKNGNIWVSSFSTCLHYYDGKTFHSLDIQHARHHTFHMITDKSGNIWMATRNDGVCRYNGTIIESFTAKDGVVDDHASCLYEAQNGTIWFGSLGKSSTNGAGLKGLTTYNGKKFTAILPTNLRNAAIWTVLEDNAGYIWVGTKEFGLFRYDGKTFTEFTTFTN